MSASMGVLKRFTNARALAVLVVLVAYAGIAAYYIMSDMSVQGLTVKVFYVSRFCTTDSGILDKVVNYEVHASVWSTQSLRTSITSLQFSLATGGREVSTATASDVSLNPGDGAPFTLTFKDSTLDPGSLPRSLDLVLSITATVSAGIVSSTLTRSDSVTQDFGGTSC